MSYQRATILWNKQVGEWVCQVPGCSYRHVGGSRFIARGHCLKDHRGLLPTVLTGGRAPKAVTSQEKEEAKQRDKRRRQEREKKRRLMKKQQQREEESRPLVPPPSPNKSYQLLILSPQMPPRQVSVLMLADGGTGDWSVVGGVGPVMEESARVAFSWVRLNLHRVVSCLLPPTSAPSYDLSRDFDLNFDMKIILHEYFRNKDGPSASLAFALSVLDTYMGDYGVQVKQGCAVTGELDLCGQVLPVGDLVDKLGKAYEAGCTMVVAPRAEAEALLADARNQEGRLPPQLREYALAVLHPVSHIVEAIACVFDGLPSPMPTMEPFLPSQVSECPYYSIVTDPGLVNRVQCCSVPSGSKGGDLILTGCASSATRDCVSVGLFWFRFYREDILKSLGLLHHVVDKGRRRLVVEDLYGGERRDRDLHIHFAPVCANRASICGGAFSVALVSLITGRAVRPNLAVMGEMDARGELPNTAELDHEDVRSCLEVYRIKQLAIGVNTAARVQESLLQLQGLKLLPVSYLQDSIGSLLQVEEEDS